MVLCDYVTSHRSHSLLPTSPQPTDILFTMSLLTREGRITVKAFASVPALADLPEIQQEPGSVSNISSFQGTSGYIDLAEGCILTKSIKYTHQLTHWVNAAHSGDPKEVISRRLIGDYSPQLLSAISFRRISLNST
jgi:hypothetical protein